MNHYGLKLTVVDASIIKDYKHMKKALHIAVISSYIEIGVGQAALAFDYIFPTSLM